MKESKRIVINFEKCTSSGECVKVCPVGAIQIKDGKAVIDHGKCDLDGLHAQIKPSDLNKN